MLRVISEVQNEKTEGIIVRYIQKEHLALWKKMVDEVDGKILDIKEVDKISKVIHVDELTEMEYYG